MEDRDEIILMDDFLHTSCAEAPQLEYRRSESDIRIAFLV